MTHPWIAIIGLAWWAGAVVILFAVWAVNCNPQTKHLLEANAGVEVSWTATTLIAALWPVAFLLWGIVQCIALLLDIPE